MHTCIHGEGCRVFGAFHPDGRVVLSDDGVVSNGVETICAERGKYVASITHEVSVILAALRR